MLPFCGDRDTGAREACHYYGRDRGRQPCFSEGGGGVLQPRCTLKRQEKAFQQTSVTVHATVGDGTSVRLRLSSHLIESKFTSQVRLHSRLRLGCRWSERLARVCRADLAHRQVMRIEINQAGNWLGWFGCCCSAAMRCDGFASGQGYSIASVPTVQSSIPVGGLGRSRLVETVDRVVD